MKEYEFLEKDLCFDIWNAENLFRSHIFVVLIFFPSSIDRFDDAECLMFVLILIT